MPLHIGNDNNYDSVAPNEELKDMINDFVKPLSSDKEEMGYNRA